MLVFDIETGPLPEDKIGHLFDEKSVKVGNLKDPEKIAKKKEEAKEKFLADAALSAITGQVLAIGVARDGGENEIVHAGDLPEAQIITSFWETITSPENWETNIVGFYSNKFDIPFLVRRSFLLDVLVPAEIHGKRYLPPRFIDLHEVWQCGDRQASGKLHDIDVALGNPGKPEGTDGGDFARLFHHPDTREEALAYLSNDLDMTWRVAGALQVL